MGTWIMTLTTRRQLTNKDASVQLRTFAFSRDGAQKRLLKKAQSVYGENFSVTALARNNEVSGA
jgi:hypothetical protein